MQIEALQRGGGCGGMGAAAADITWRHYTWEDSVAKVCDMCTRVTCARV